MRFQYSHLFLQSIWSLNMYEAHHCVVHDLMCVYLVMEDMIIQHDV